MTPAARDSGLPIHRARGQSLVEFSLVAVILFPFLFALILFMLNLGQAWSMSRALEGMGQEIATTGSFNIGNFVDDTSRLGFPWQPANGDTLTITVTDTVDDSSSSYDWDTGTSGDSTFNVVYGDLISIKATKGTGQSFATPLVNMLPNVEVSWNGVAQRNTSAEGTGTCSDVPTPVGCVNSTTGEVTGTVRDASDGSVIAGVLINFGSGNTATTNASGRYGISNLDPGNYTVSATKNGYQDASSTVRVISGVTTARDFTLESAAIIDVTVTLSNPANLVVNGDFETGFTGPWTSGVGLFNLPPVQFAINSTETHSGGSSGAVDITPAGGGAYQDISDTLIAGHSYRAAVWVKGEVGAPISLHLGDSDSEANASITATGDWQLLSATWIPGVTTTSAQIAINGDLDVGGPATSTFYFDDAEVEDTANTVNDATVTTSSGLTAVATGNGHYTLVVAPGSVTVRVNAPGGLSGGASFSGVSAGVTTYVYITIN